MFELYGWDWVAFEYECVECEIVTLQAEASAKFVVFSGSCDICY